MRMAIGLAGILVTMGVIIWIMSQITLPATKQALDVKKQVEPKVEQIAGHTADGTRAVDTVQVKAEQRAGRMSALIVTKVVEGAAMDKHFGLREGDAITEIGPLSVRDMGAVDEAKDYLVAEYQRSGQITVRREGKEIKLPLPASARAAETPPASPAETPAATPADSGSSGDALQKQLDAIPGVPR